MTYYSAANSLMIINVLSRPYNKIITSSDHGKKIFGTIPDKTSYSAYFPLFCVSHYAATKLH